MLSSPSLVESHLERADPLHQFGQFGGAVVDVEDGRHRWALVGCDRTISDCLQHRACAVTTSRELVRASDDLTQVPELGRSRRDTMIGDIATLAEF